MNKYQIAQRVSVCINHHTVEGTIYAVYRRAVWLLDEAGNHWHFDPRRDERVTILSNGSDTAKSDSGGFMAQF